MGNIHSLERPGELNAAELQRLERRLRRIGRGRAEIARSDLLSVEGLGGNPFLERIFALSDAGRKQRIRAKQLVTSVIDIADNDGLLELEDVIGLLKQLSTLEADEEARYKFAFALFDINRDGYIDRKELFSVLQMTNKRAMTTTQLEQIVESTMARWDGGEGRLTYPAFRSLLSASSANLSL